MPSALFSPLELRGPTLNNRMAVSPMCQYTAENGSAVDRHLMHLGQFSMGAAGLVMTEATAVSAAGRITPKCLGLYSGENEATLKRVIDFCRNYDVTPMGVQLAHAGRKGSAQIPLDGGKSLQPDEDPWTVGMITKARQTEEIIAEGKADIVALARGMMFDPRWAWHAAEELGVETEYSKMYARCAPRQWPEVFPWREK